MQQRKILGRLGVDTGREGSCFAWRYRLSRLQGGEVLGDENKRDSILGRSRLAQPCPGRAGRGTPPKCRRGIRLSTLLPNFTPMRS